MKQKLLLPISLILFLAFGSSFIKPNHETTKPRDCYNFVSIHAVGSGLTIVRATFYVNGSQVSNNTGLNITNGQYQDFSSPYFTQGANITVEVACQGGGGATRM